MAVLGVTCLQGGWPAAVFYPLGHPTPYAYEQVTRTNGGIKNSTASNGFVLIGKFRDVGSRAVFHGGSKGSGTVSLGPTIPYHATSCRKRTPGRPDSFQGVGRLENKSSILVSEPPGIPMKYDPGERNKLFANFQAGGVLPKLTHQWEPGHMSWGIQWSSRTAQGRSHVGSHP
jgi:hypothetical protein